MSGSSPSTALTNPVAIVGVPFDAYSSFLRGAALGPARFRETLYSASGNWFTELGYDLSSRSDWKDLGDFPAPVEDFPLDRIQAAAEDTIRKGYRLLAVGGDHSITYPLVAAHSSVYGPPVILHLDAHGDLYDSLDGNRYSHACPFARIMDAGYAELLFQAGLRALTDHQREQATRYGVRMLEMRDTSPETVLKSLEEVLPSGFGRSGIYLSLDLDVLDPAFAPGVSHHEPGGMTTREVLTIIQELPVPLLGADIVEFNPVRDPSGITGTATAKLAKEVVAKMLFFDSDGNG